MFSFLEQHNDGSWWYEPRLHATFETKEEVDKYFQNVWARYVDPNRPYMAFEHEEPLYQVHATCTQDFKVFEFGGLIRWPKNMEGVLMSQYTKNPYKTAEEYKKNDGELMYVY